MALPPSEPRAGRSPLVRGPRGAFRWTAFALAVTAFASATPTPLYPSYAATFHFSSATLGLVFAAYTPGVLLTLFFLAPHAERVGRRTLLTLGLLLAAVGAVVFSIAHGVAELALGRLVAGLAVGATTSVATAAMSDLEPFRDQHHVARVAVAANFGGFALGVLLSGAIVAYAPDPARWAYALPVIAVGIGLLGVGATPETAPSFVPGRGRPVQRVSVPPALWRPFWVAAGGIAACYAIYGYFAALVPSYLRLDLAVRSPLAIGAFVALMFGVAAMTQLTTAQIRDRAALLLGLPILVASLLALVVVIHLSIPVLLVPATLLLGVAVGLTFMGSVTLVDRVAEEEDRGEILAGFYSAGYLALAVPTIGIAEAADRVGLTSAGILFGALLAVAVGATYVITLRTATPPGGGGRPRGPSARAE